MPYSSGGGGGLTLIGQAVADGTSATLTVGSIPGTYKDLVIVFQGRSTQAASNNETAAGRFNADAGANYDRAYAGSAGGAADVGQVLGATGMGYNVPAATSTAGMATTFQWTVPNYSGTTWWKYSVGTTSFANSGAWQNSSTAYRWKSTAAITSVSQVITGAGNWVAGSTLTVYGVT